jgi:hypothetical protein
MNTEAFIANYWHSVTAQDANALRGCFHPNARIRWHNTNEQFTAAEFIRANCEYPGHWHGEMERIERSGETVITVTHIWSDDLSFHAVSFFEMADHLIQQLDEYWSDDGPAPRWRQDMNIGKPIQ